MDLGGFYRPEYTDISFTNILYQALNDIKSEAPEATIWLGGDFNHPDIDWNDNHFVTSVGTLIAVEPSSVMPQTTALGRLSQKATREHNILDLFFCNRPSQVNRTAVLPSIEVSDHYPVFVEVSANPIVVTKPPRAVPQYNKVNWDNFRSMP